MKELLSRQFGPFNGATWLGIIAGGVGLGLFIRKRVGGTKGAAPSEAGTMVMTPSFPLDGDTQYNEGKMIDNVRAALSPEFGAIWEAIEKGKGADPAPTNPPVAKTPLEPQSYEGWRQVLLALGHDPKKVVNEEDIRVGFKIVGHDPKKVINPEDLRVLADRAFQKVGIRPTGEW